jgi:hypothetical protein
MLHNLVAEENLSRRGSRSLLDKIDIDNPNILKYNRHVTTNNGDKWRDFDIKRNLRRIPRKKIQRIMIDDKYDFVRRFFRKKKVYFTNRMR